MFKNKLNYFPSDVSDFLENEIIHLNFYEDKWQFDYLVNFKKSDKLIILMPAAMAKGKRFVPAFHRHSWINLLDANVVCISDPTLRLSDDLLGGWFQGAKNDFILHRVVDHILKFIELFKIKTNKIVVAGSSLGGWASIYISTLIKGVKSYSENPQTDLKNYYSGPTNLLNKYVFEGELNFYLKNNSFRFSLCDLMEKENYIHSMYVVQKVSDEYHYKNHFLPLVERVNKFDIKKSNVIFEEIGDIIDDTGHTALNFADASKRLNFLLAM